MNYSELRKQGTQGEWKITFESIGLMLSAGEGDEEEAIYTCEPSDQTDAANARLIAHEHNHFPALLEALGQSCFLCELMHQIPRDEMEQCKPCVVGKALRAAMEVPE